MRARIESSQITKNGLEVRWNDGVHFVFDPTNLSQNPDISHNTEWPMSILKTEAEVLRRITVSRTSAQLSLNV